jgi:hypothetical protein
MTGTRPLTFCRSLGCLGGTVAEPDTVAVVDPCGEEAAAGLVVGDGGASGWCAIDDPIEGS